MYPGAYMSHFLLHERLNPVTVLSIVILLPHWAERSRAGGEAIWSQVGGNWAPRRSRTVSACLWLLPV